jgi:hypothetical protein
MVNQLTDMELVNERLGDKVDALIRANEELEKS